MSYTPVPNEVYHIGLTAGAIAVYGYLLHIENRQTFKCYAGYKTISKAVKMSANTVRKYVEELETRHLIRTEQTSCVSSQVKRAKICHKVYQSGGGFSPQSIPAEEVS